MEAAPERDQTPEEHDEPDAQPTIITLIPVSQEEIPTMPEMAQPNETNNNTIVTNAVVINNDGSAKVVGKGKDFSFWASTPFWFSLKQQIQNIGHLVRGKSAYRFI
jgi:hypothetical protein